MRRGEPIGMSHSALSSSYQQYKEDTNAFITWLSEAAKACGWKPPKNKKPEKQQPVQMPVLHEVLKAPRLKGKARKLAKNAEKAHSGKAWNGAEEQKSDGVKRTISTGVLSQHVELVSEWRIESAILMPEGFQRVLGRAIAARRRFASWFQRTDGCNIYSNETHQYFIDVLQKAADTLRPEDGPTPAGKNEASPKPAEKALTFEPDVMRNYFSVLNLYQPDEPSEGDDISPVAVSHVVSGTSVPEQPQQQEKDQTVYELEENPKRTLRSRYSVSLRIYMPSMERYGESGPSFALRSYSLLRQL